MPRPRIPDYGRKLSRPITVADGRVLTTLKHAADLIREEFGAVNLKWGALDDAIVLLIEAAEHGGEKIEAATSQLELVVHERRLL